MGRQSGSELVVVNGERGGARGSGRGPSGKRANGAVGKPEGLSGGEVSKPPRVPREEKIEEVYTCTILQVYRVHTYADVQDNDGSEPR